MTRAALLLAVALAACGGAQAPAPSNTPAPPTDSITLKAPSPAVGESWTRERSMKMQLSIAAGGQQMPFDSSEHSIERWTVVQAAGNTVTQATISFDVFEKSQRVAGKEQLPPSRIAGKTYTVTAGDPLTVATATGAAPDDEAKEVREELKHFGEPDRLSAAIDGMTFARGERVEVPADKLDGVLGGEGHVQSVTLTYQGTEHGVAQFDMTMDATVDSGGSTIEFDLEGPVQVDLATYELVASTMNGPVSMTGAASATGTMSLSETVSFPEAR